VQILRDLLTRGVSGIALSPVNADAVLGVIARVADAMLAEVSLHRGEFVVCGDELLLRPIPDACDGLCVRWMS
jgi:ABC-type sugar transport system substrate-binding protein